MFASMATILLGLYARQAAAAAVAAARGEARTRLVFRGRDGRQAGSAALGVELDAGPPA